MVHVRDGPGPREDRRKQYKIHICSLHSLREQAVVTEDSEHRCAQTIVKDKTVTLQLCRRHVGLADMVAFNLLHGQAIANGRIATQRQAEVETGIRINPGNEGHTRLQIAESMATKPVPRGVP